MRTILLASVVLLLNLSRASAQDAEVPPSYQHSSVDLSVQTPETPSARHAHHQQQLGQALMGSGATVSILTGVVGGAMLFVNMFNSVGGVRVEPFPIAMLSISGLSLVTFFIGLGLDIDARVQLGHETSLAIGPTGVELTF